MPELPDVTLYVERLSACYAGAVLRDLRFNSPFVLRTVTPAPAAVKGKRVLGLERLGKRVVFCLEDELFIVVHLMIAGRFHQKPAGARLAGRAGIAAFDFDTSALFLTEVSTKKRAAIHIIAGRAALAELDRGGVEVLTCGRAAFAAALRRENHTLKRALTDPTLFSGIGNAYSDEILHAARLSPMALTERLTDEEVTRLHDATVRTLRTWIERLRREVGEGFPEKVTAFHAEMAVHGRYRKPCPDCGAPIQRIVYAENECNYCPRCQTEDRILADRSLSRLLKKDWPRTLDELERLRPSRIVTPK